MSDKERLANSIEFNEKLLKHINKYNREFEKVAHIPGRKSQTTIIHLGASDVHNLMRDLRLVLKGKKAKYLLKDK